ACARRGRDGLAQGGLILRGLQERLRARGARAMMASSPCAVHHEPMISDPARGVRIGRAAEDTALADPNPRAQLPPGPAVAAIVHRGEGAAVPTCASAAPPTQHSA